MQDTSIRQVVLQLGRGLRLGVAARVNLSPPRHIGRRVIVEVGPEIGRALFKECLDAFRLVPVT